MKQTYFLGILLLIVLSSCKKSSNSAVGSGRVIVVNEGGFNHADADISIYDPNSKTVSNNIFSQVNGSPPGDVAQSVYLIGDTAFIVMNNSAKIVVADAGHNFKYMYTINIPGSSPRFFQPVGGSKAYVTELYNNTIWVIDYRAGTVLRSIPVDGKTEQMVTWGGKVYVEEATKPYLGSGAVPPVAHAILTVDPLTDQVTHALPLPVDPASMVLVQDNLYVLSARQDSPAVSASLYKIALSSSSIAGHADFSLTRNPTLLRYSTLSNQILFSDSGGIYIMHPTDALPTSPWIVSNNWNVYGLNADPTNGDIYISDAVDYQQASKVMRYSISGSSLDHFSAGIITNGFVFR